MEQIELIEPQKKYADDIWKFRQEVLECDAENEDRFAGCMSLDVSESAEEWIKICALRKSEETCGETGTTVPSHTYLAVRKSDDKVVGNRFASSYKSSYSWNVGRTLRIFSAPF